MLSAKEYLEVKILKVKEAQAELRAPAQVEVLILLENIFTKDYNEILELENHPNLLEDANGGTLVIDETEEAIRRRTDHLRLSIKDTPLNSIGSVTAIRRG